MYMNLDENLAVTLGGGFFGGILGYALKKFIKMEVIIAGLFLATLTYLHYQQIASIKWDRLLALS
jgi:uncharacterized membrane protein (Fun14 family)